jgi:transmembrane sensor
MSEMKRHLVTPSDDTADAAAGWFALHRSGEMTKADQAEFAAWLAADPAHAAAFRKAEHAWATAEAMRTHPDVLALREEAVLTVRRRRWTLGPLPIAASIAAAFVLAGATVTVSDSWDGVRLLFGPIKQELRTSVGQRTTITLPDGSIVTLDTDTAIRTIESRRERRVELARGQAFFKVAKDASRPFVVVAGDRKVTALGTAFGVRIDRNRFQLTMVEGVVRVEAPLSAAPGAPAKMQSARMAAGSQLVAVVNSQWTIRPVDPVKETGWTRGLLIYEATPLAKVTAELNRYSDRKIVIDDPKVAARLVNGTFRATDVEGAVTALENYGLIAITAEDDDTIHLAAAEKNPAAQGM